MPVIITPKTTTAGIGRLLRNVFLLSAPFVALLASYFALDPFHVLYHYPKFDKPLLAIPNRDYISTQMYLNTYEKRPYQSFIVGNSRTLAFSIRDWVPYIQDTLAFHYDASGESLYGVWKKLQFVEQHHSPLKNVLLICDAELLAKTDDSPSHLFRKDPRITGEHPLPFQFTFLKAYSSNLFFYHFIMLRTTGHFTSGMAGMLESRRVYFDPVTNDLSLPDINKEIRKDSVGFFTRNAALKTARKPSTGTAVIGPAQLRQLVAIRNIFTRHRTNYRIVISPLFNQTQINPADIAQLQRVFAADRIHDYSGVNAFTANLSNYYEDSHYRPLVGNAILRQIYAPVK